MLSHKTPRIIKLFCDSYSTPRNLFYGFFGHRQMATKPGIYQQLPNGSETEITADELFRYSRYRWLSDDAEKQAMRFRKFNLLALQEAAIHAVDGANSCVKILKCVEGQYNKALVVTMDNGTEVLARMPNPNAGPAFYTTASEVATKRFLRDVLGVPVPYVHFYSPHESTPVGAEFIIEEKAKGVLLGSVWSEWSIDSKSQMVMQLIDLEKKLASFSFAKHGCIYYKENLETKGHTVLPSDIISLPPSVTDTGKSLPVDLFALGPLTAAQHWEGERETLPIDVGPWQTHQSYMMAVGNNELLWAEAYAKPQ